MSIYDKVQTFIHSPAPDLFERLAWEVFNHQFETIEPYRRFCEQQRAYPAAISSIDSVPAVSNVAFKFVDLTQQPGAPHPDARVFLTSGTTQGRDRRGRHVVPRPEIYRASALAHLRTMLFPDARRMAMLAMHPTADLMPESSLSPMITWCVEEFGTGTRLAAASRSSVDVDAAIRFLGDREARREPVCILGTTASFAALFTALGERAKKIGRPASSRLMDTGGAKGQATPLAARDVIRLAGELLALPPAMVINEYGMTELCSQLYDATPFNCAESGASSERFKVAPPWMRVTARDPVTLRPVADGEMGLLTFFDLANVGSVSAVMTEDLGTVESGRVRVVGRIDAGDARGCALSIEQFAAAERSQPVDAGRFEASR
ncbi:MAG TPA: hypothetical protein VEU51_11095 [Candidatus Acidoferrales bacterium]|nr:hypothetical protein [Candidatus Acidoferrales bacterium]